MLVLRRFSYIFGFDLKRKFFLYAEVSASEWFFGYVYTCSVAIWDVLGKALQAKKRQKMS